MSVPGFLEQAWRALGEPTEHRALIEASPLPALASPLPVARLVQDSVTAASLAASLLAGGRTVRVAPARVWTAVSSDKHFRSDGEPPAVWAELSGFWRTADGWVRTHANYPHHRDRLLRLLGLPAGAVGADLADALAEFTANELESRAAEAGAVAVATRSVQDWDAHPQARAIRSTPLIGVQGGDAGQIGQRRPAAPLAGTKVLDLSRVIAGPVATRTLALFGADVLRVDSPRLTEPEWQHLDTGASKRSTLLDFADRRDLERVHELLDSADVLLCGYRPGSLDRYGLDRDALRESHPELVIGSLSAWGEVGPWAGRRGFDSIVQAASGIAQLCADAEGIPGALPVQALDHASGYFLAAGIMSALRREGGAVVTVALARTAQALLDAERPGETSARPPKPSLVDYTVGGHRITVSRPAPGYDAGPQNWPAPPRRWGADPAEWLGPAPRGSL